MPPFGPRARSMSEPAVPMLKQSTARGGRRFSFSNAATKRRADKKADLHRAMGALEFRTAALEQDYMDSWMQMPQGSSAWVLILVVAAAAAHEELRSRHWATIPTAVLVTAVGLLAAAPSALCSSPDAAAATTRWPSVLGLSCLSRRHRALLLASTMSTAVCLLQAWRRASARVANAHSGDTAVVPASAIAAIFLATNVAWRHSLAQFCGLALGLLILAMTQVAGCSSFSFSIGLLLITAAAIRSRWESELSLRTLFLDERRVTRKAQEFYSVLAGMLPPQVVHRYFGLCLDNSGDNGVPTIGTVSMAQRRERVGVLFVAICDFDKMVADRSARFVVKFLSQLFSDFDKTCSNRADITKIETVGEVYVSACGLFPARDNRTGEDAPPDLCDFEEQFESLADLALHMHETAARFAITLRCGLHTGPVIAGIVGHKLPRFRLFGDTVNVAARLEQHCPPGCVLLSADAREILGQNLAMRMAMRDHGMLPMKGLGEMKTYALEPPSAAAGEATPEEASPKVPSRRASADRVTFELGESTDLEGNPCREQSDLELPGCIPYTRRDSTMSVASTSIPGSPPSSMRRASSITPGSTKSSFSSPHASIFDDDDENDDSPVHKRTKTPTFHLSVESQLGRGRRPSWVTMTPWPGQAPPASGAALEDAESSSEEEEDEEEASTPMTPARSDASADSSVAPASLSETGPICDACAVLPQDSEQVQQELMNSLHAEQHICGSIWPHFRDEDTELAFRRAHAFGRLDEFGEASPPALRRLWWPGFCIMAMILLMVPFLTVVEDIMALVFAVAVLFFAAFAPRVAVAVWPAQLRGPRGDVSSGLVPPWLALQLAALATSLACTLMSKAFRGGSLAPMTSWAVLVAGFFLQLPFPAALLSVVACSSSALCLHWNEPDVMAGFLVAPALLAVLQWAGERVNRRRYLVQQLEQDTHGRMQTVAENLMPPSVVQELRRIRFGKKFAAAGAGTPLQDRTSFVSHSYPLLTVLQADLAGFTAFARSKPPEEVLVVINGLFSIFDEYVTQRNVYKMETIGDAYVCASGLPDYNDGVHSASSMLYLALEFVRAVSDYKERIEGLPESLGVRAGVHSGHCVGGVVGETMQRFHLFGRTMHIVEVIESTAPSYSVHLSAATKASVDKEVSDGQHYEATAVPRLSFSRVDGDLMTSKGEVVPRGSIDDLETFLLKADEEEPEATPERTDDATCSSRLQRCCRSFSEAFGPSGAVAFSRSLDQLDLAVRWHSAVRSAADTRASATAMSMASAKSRRSWSSDSSDHSPTYAHCSERRRATFH